MRRTSWLAVALVACAPDWSVVGKDDTDADVVPDDDDVADTVDAPTGDTAPEPVDTDAGSDADGDATPDDDDLCAGLDDRIDLDANAVPDCAETLVANPQFAAGLAPWTTRTLGRNVATATHDPAGDAAGWSGSGAAVVVNTTAYIDANAAGLVSECIAGQPGETFHLWFHALVASADVPGDPVQVIPSYLVYADAGCSVPAASVTPGPPTTVLDAWTVMNPLGPLVLDAGWYGFQVQLEVFKPGTAEDVRFRLDDVLVARR